MTACLKNRQEAVWLEETDRKTRRGEIREAIGSLALPSLVFF